MTAKSLRAWLMSSVMTLAMASPLAAQTVPPPTIDQLAAAIKALNLADSAQRDSQAALTARVDALEKKLPPPPPPASLAESVNLTTVPPAAQIVDHLLSTYKLLGGQAIMNGKPVANTSGVKQLKKVDVPAIGGPGGVFQQTGTGSTTTWWGPITPLTGGPQLAGDPAAVSPPPPPPPIGDVPAQAAAVGYTTRTLGPLVEPDKNWFFIQGGVNTKNADGSLTIAGGPGYSDNLQTMTLVSAGQFKGATFGCGLFSRVVMRYTGPPPYGVPVPAFWWNDWENQDTYAFGTGRSQWPGQAKGYVDSIEWDQGEINNGYGSWGFTIHNWYAQQAQIQDVIATNDGSPAMGLNDQDGQFHTYDGLWVPATGSSQGYIKHWFDGKLVGNPITWNKYDPAKPPPPVQGDNAFSRIDVSHIYGILGTSGANPMTVKEFSVYQGPGACNQFK